MVALFGLVKPVHHTGPLLEENHYYPFGLAMAAISARALKTNYTENKLRYNGGSELQNREFSDGSGLEMYETSFRGYDAQTGRFAQIDPMAGSYLDYSSYAYTANNPVLFSDPTGLKLVPTLNRNCSDCFIMMGSGGNDKQFGSMGGDGSSDWSILTGQGNTSFDSWVSAANQQIDEEVNSANLLSTLNQLLAVMPDESLIKLTNDNNETWSVTGHANVDNAHWQKDKAGNVTGIAYTYSYGVPGATEEGDLHQSLNTLYTVGGSIKYNTYGLFDPAGSFDPNASADEGSEKGDGWRTAGVITESLELSYETTEQSVKGFQKIANILSGTNAKILDAGKIGKLGGIGLGLLSMGATTVDGLENGWQNHHTADLLITTGEIALGIFEYTNPIGWGFAAGIFIGNLISEHYTQKSLTENLFDK